MKTIRKDVIIKLLEITRRILDERGRGLKLRINVTVGVDSFGEIQKDWDNKEGIVALYVLADSLYAGKWPTREKLGIYEDGADEIVSLAVALGKFIHKSIDYPDTASYRLFDYHINSCNLPFGLFKQELIANGLLDNDPMWLSIHNAPSEREVEKCNEKQNVAAVEDKLVRNDAPVYNALLSCARKYVKSHCHKGEDIIIRDFLHSALPSEYKEIISNISDASEEQFKELLAAIEKPRINIERVNDIHDNTHVKAGL